MSKAVSETMQRMHLCSQSDRSSLEFSHVMLLQPALLFPHNSNYTRSLKQGRVFLSASLLTVQECFRAQFFNFTLGTRRVVKQPAVLVLHLSELESPSVLTQG